MTSCIITSHCVVLYFTEDEMLGTAGDLLGAGTETTTTALTWCIVYILRYPETLARIQDEVDNVIGSARLPSMKDKLQMPYTEAFLLEILRMGDITPLGVPRVTTHSLTFHGYDLPKDTTVMPCLYSVHRDPTIFANPFTFYPERFLDEKGRVCGRETIVPFSIGLYSLFFLEYPFFLRYTNYLIYENGPNSLKLILCRKYV